MTTQFKHQIELKIMRIQISCMDILSEKGQFRVSSLKYCYIEIWAEIKVRKTPGSMLRKPTSQSTPVSLSWIKPSHELLHERIKEEHQH